MAGNNFLLGLVITAILLSCVPTSASEEYTLGVFGNANEDDTIDVEDVEYAEQIVLGLDDRIDLADAKYNRKINILDVTQTELIILGKEKELTIIDGADRIVTVPRPIERVITLQPPITRMVIGSGDADTLVGMGTWDHTYVINDYQRVGLDAPKWNEVVNELKELPDVGTGYSPNIEVILSLKPDVVIAGQSSMAVLDKFQEDTGIPVVYSAGGTTSDAMFEDIRLIATVLGKEERSEEIITFFKEKLDEVTEITSEIPDSEKQRVYFFWGSELTKASIRYEPIELAGGILVSKDCAPATFGGSVTDVSKEQIIEWNPDIILVGINIGRHDPTVEDILSDPDLQTVNAVKNGCVYYTLGAYYLIGADHPRVITETLIQAKLFYPDKFGELDIDEGGNELFERFYGVEGLWTEFNEQFNELYHVDPWADFRDE